MNLIQCNVLLSVLVLISVATSGCSDEYPPEIDVEIRRHEGSEAGFFIKVGEKEFRGKEPTVEFVKDITKHLSIVPDLKATFHIDDYIRNAEFYGQHVIPVAREAMNVGLRNLTVHVPESEELGEDVYRLPSEVEDVVLPKADCCKNLKKPEHRHLIVTVTRPGHYVQDRRDWGRVDESLEKIRNHLLEEANAAGREPDGYSKLEVLIRADKEADFKYVQHVLKICEEKEIRIYKTRLNCSQNALELSLDGKFSCKLKDGEISIYRWKKTSNKPVGDIGEMIRRGAKEVTILLYIDKESEADFVVQVELREFRGKDVLAEFYKHVKEIQKNNPDKEFIIYIPDGVKVAQVAKVLNECVRAGLKKVEVRD